MSHLAHVRKTNFVSLSFWLDQMIITHLLDNISMNKILQTLVTSLIF